MGLINAQTEKILNLEKSLHQKKQRKALKAEAEAAALNSGNRHRYQKPPMDSNRTSSSAHKNTMKQGRQNSNDERLIVSQRDHSR